MSHVHAGVRCCDVCGEPLTGETRWIIIGDPPATVPCPDCTRPEAKLAWMMRNPREVRRMSEDRWVVTPAQWRRLQAMLDRPARRLPRLERLMRETPPWRDDEPRDETS